MSNKISNFPTNQEVDCQPGEMAEKIDKSLYLANLPKVDLKDAEAIRERCQLYFDFCKKHDSRPFLQGLCLALQTNRQTLCNLESEQSERGSVIRQAKQILRTLLEDWSLTGRLNPATSIFLMKNIMGYKDSVVLEAQAVTTTPKAERTPEEIKRMIAEDLPSLSDDNSV